MISEPNVAIKLFRNCLSVMRPRREGQWIKIFPSVPQQDVLPSILFYRLFFFSLVGKLFKDVESKEAGSTTRVHREKEDKRVITRVKTHGVSSCGLITILNCKTKIHLRYANFTMANMVEAYFKKWIHQALISVT